MLGCLGGTAGLWAFTQKNFFAATSRFFLQAYLVTTKTQGIGQKLHFFAKNILIFSTAAWRGVCEVAFCHVIGATDGYPASTCWGMRAYG